MKVLCWNVRGCNKPFKQKEIRIFLQSNKVDVAFLLKTRVKVENAQKIVNKICRGWQLFHNYDSARNERIWCCLNPKSVKLRVLDEHEQALQCEIVDVYTGRVQQFIAIYALNTPEQRISLWGFIEGKYQQAQGPLVMGGDFNAILSSDDRFQGNPVTQSDIEDFQHCIQHNELQEIRAIGPQFTWTNNQVVECRILSNIDRCFANTQWFVEYSNVVVERLEKNISDHCPQILKFEVIREMRGLFKFYNAIADHDQFESIVKDGWKHYRSSNLLWDIWLKCQHLKRPLKLLNTTWYKRTTEKVGELRENLKEIQHKIHTGSVVC